jgi:hypothetical protein
MARPMNSPIAIATKVFTIVELWTIALRSGATVGAKEIFDTGVRQEGQINGRFAELIDSRIQQSKQICTCPQGSNVATGVADRQMIQFFFLKQSKNFMKLLVDVSTTNIDSAVQQDTY